MRGALPKILTPLTLLFEIPYPNKASLLMDKHGSCQLNYPIFTVFGHTAIIWLIQALIISTSSLKILILTVNYCCNIIVENAVTTSQLWTFVENDVLQLLQCPIPLCFKYLCPFFPLEICQWITVICHPVILPIHMSPYAYVESTLNFLVV